MALEHRALPLGKYQSALSPRHRPLSTKPYHQGSELHPESVQKCGKVGRNYRELLLFVFLLCSLLLESMVMSLTMEGLARPSQTKADHVRS